MATSVSENQSGQIAPESPRFIEIPRSPQQNARNIPRQKGFLPRPRRIFSFKDAKDKASPEYLAAVTPEPNSQENNADPATKDMIDWRTRMASSRRRNLRESLVELQHRKQKRDRQVATRTAYKEKERARLLAMPERDDEAFTNPSILQALQSTRGGLIPDPDREARLAEKKARVEAKEAARREERRSALHDLYMNSANFITSVRVLESVVEKVFNQPNFGSDSGTGENIWNKGYPETVQEMLNRVNKSGDSKAIDYYQGYGAITKERLDRIAEELTGGKISNT